LTRIGSTLEGARRAFIESHKLRLPARARSAGTSIANVTDVALKKLRGGWGNGGSAGHRKTERSDRQSNNKAEGDEATGAASSPLVFLQGADFLIIHPILTPPPDKMKWIIA